MIISIYIQGHKYYYKDKELKINNNLYGCSAHCRNWVKSYLIDNIFHNELGPAVIYASGHVEYWFKNRMYPKILWEKIIKK